MDSIEHTRTVSLRELLWRAARAPIVPSQVFGNLDDRTPYYKTVLPFLSIVGIVWIHLHSYLLFVSPVWSDTSRWILYTVLFAAFPVATWLGFSLMVQKCIGWFGERHTLYRVEQGVFNLVIVWALLPLLDIPHLFFPVTLVTVPLFGTHPLHFSHIVALIIIPIELIYLFKYIVGKRAPIIFMAALMGLPITKFVFEDLGFLLEEGAYKIGFIAGKYDDSVFGFLWAWPTWILLIVLRGRAIGWGWKKIIVVAAIVGLPTALVGGMTLARVEPLYPDYATDSGILDSSRDHRYKEKDFLFADSVYFDFDPFVSPIRRLTCSVRFLQETEQPVIGEDHSTARCDIAPGPESGAGDFTLKGDEWNNLNGASERKTSWTDPILLRSLTRSHNDIRVHIRTVPGDRVIFSGVWVEVEH